MGQSPADGGPPVALGANLEALSGDALAAVVGVWKRQGRQLQARFGGSSMLPTLAPGVELSFLCGSPVEVGDVAVLLHRGQILVHRVVARCDARRLMLTRGDGTWVPDPPMAEEQVVGRVTQVRQGSEWMTPPPGPDSWRRRFVVRACAKGLAASESWGRLLITALWYWRLGTERQPATLLRTLRGASALREDKGADHGQPQGE